MFRSGRKIFIIYIKKGYRVHYFKNNLFKNTYLEFINSLISYIIQYWEARYKRTQIPHTNLNYFITLENLGNLNVESEKNGNSIKYQSSPAEDLILSAYDLLIKEMKTLLNVKSWGAVNQVKFKTIILSCKLDLNISKINYNIEKNDTYQKERKYEKCFL
ncbi:MAG: hypothetical protein N2490_03730 [Ignavibacteria bacterium]|nr:hypothetical protein [Ignavibacteria bacterium]